MPVLRLSIARCAYWVLAFSLLYGGVACAADFQFSPRISVSSEYNDNVTQTKQAKSDFLWLIKPGLSATYEHSRVFANLSYDFEFKKYQEGNSSNEKNHYLNALTKVEALKELFFIEVSDDYKKVFRDVTRGDVPEGDTNVNTTDQNTFGVKPYFVIPLQERTNLTAGGEFRDIWYSKEGSVDKRNYRLFSDLTHDLTERWSLTGGAGFEMQDPRFEEGGFKRYNLVIGTKYSYAEGSYVELNWKPTYTDFTIQGASNKQYNPYSLNLVHAFSGTLSASASTSMYFSEDPSSADTLNTFTHKVSLSQQYDRGEITCSLAYNDYENNDSISRSTYWRPSLGGTHSLTERLALRYNAYVDMHSNPDSDKYIFSMLGLSYSLSASTSASLSYRFKNSDKQGSANDYTSNTLGLTLSWQY
ncbi:TIGR03016 family PEP-CTERM system-associated outer membrane protein [Pseudodesulfovibrio cashew]|uniref:TIGR03016 family PEP-CTERM system-associated outer membrane protein n=1 Tax=Pseudodesulfovibrio cashew TaxID=2678688 RepID=UPI00131D5A3A|nr:TIGR03016 family PEP-CTERM system-associated outer membrane protein [Pseudodesulfovibrio cashew]